MAVIVAKDGSVCAADEGAEIVKYGKRNGIWEEDSRVGFRIDLSSGLLAARGSAEEACRSLADCKAVIGTSVAGVPYQIFDRGGLAILEPASFDPSDLPHLEKLLDGRPESTDAVGPKAVDSEGNYEMDMISAQNAHPELSSKMLLKEFLERTPFLSLEVRCRHAPPWIEAMEDLELSSVNGPDGTLLTIRKKTCRRNQD
jgi:hypothetical protein